MFFFKHNRIEVPQGDAERQCLNNDKNNRCDLQEIEP